MKNVNKIIKEVVFGLAITAVGLWVPHTADACTGITLKSQDSATVLARTIEWGGSYLNSRYVVVPRGYHYRHQVTDYIMYVTRSQ